MGSSLTSSVQTIRGPEGPGPVRLGALEIARSKIGERETAPNQGPIVDWSLAGITSRKAAGDMEHPAGWAKWCAFFVSQCFQRELLLRGQTELARLWRADYASGSCSSLWASCERAGWTESSLEAQPQPGDLVFYGELAAKKGIKFLHVDFYERALVGAEGHFEAIGGNSRDSVARSVRTPDSKIVGYARVPW